MSKHTDTSAEKATAQATPGPWELIVSGFEPVVYAPDGRGICDVRRYESGLTVTEALANGYVLAAAPELYAELARLRDMIARNGRLVGWNSSDLDHINAVLAKAEGAS